MTVETYTYLIHRKSYYRKVIKHDNGVSRSLKSEIVKKKSLVTNTPSDKYHVDY